MPESPASASTTPSSTAHAPTARSACGTATRPTRPTATAPPTPPNGPSTPTTPTPRASPAHADLVWALDGADVKVYGYATAPAIEPDSAHDVSYPAAATDPERLAWGDDQLWILDADGHVYATGDGGTLVVDAANDNPRGVLHDSAADPTIVFPVQAGVCRTSSAIRALSCRFPRASGGVPVARVKGDRHCWFSPCKRGCAAVSNRSGSTCSVFPVQAGVCQEAADLGGYLRRFPRASGGVPE